MNAEEFKKLLKENNTENNEILKQEIRSSVKVELDSFKEEIKSEIKEMVDKSLAETGNKIGTIEQKLLQKDEEIAGLRADFLKVKSNTIALEFTTRNKNLLLFKLAENERDKQSLLIEVSRMIRDLADATFSESDVVDIYRLGKVSSAPRPIMMQLKTSSKRSYLLSQKRKFVEKNVGIAEDLPKEVQDWRKRLYDLADYLRKKGKKVVFRLDKMIVDGVELSEAQIEEELNQQRKRTRSVSPESETSTQDNSSKRVQAKRSLGLAEIPRTQTAMNQFFMPAAPMNNTSQNDHNQ